MLLALLVMGTGVAVHAGVNPASLDPASIEAAIERMRRTLLQRQDAATGSWETRGAADGDHYGHTTALVTHALLRSGVPCYTPSIERAVDFLRDLEGGDAYTLYPRVLVWAGLPESFRGDLERDVKRLQRVEDQGLFFHDNRPTERADHQSTYFGGIALAAAAQRDHPISARYWRDLADHLLKAQYRGGGWGPTDERRGNADPRSTAEALTLLYLCRFHLRSTPSVTERLTAAIGRGERSLQRSDPLNGAFAVPEVSGGASTRSPVGVSGMPRSRPLLTGSNRTHSFESPMHNLVVLERLSSASGLWTLQGEPWFQRVIIGVMQLEGGTGSIRGNLIDTALGLQLLIAARTTAWANLLTVVDGADYPSAFTSFSVLTDRLSELREHSLVGHRVNIDDPLAAWLGAPIAVLAHDRSIELSLEQVDRLRRYLNLGGLLVAVPHTPGRSGSAGAKSDRRGFVSSIERLGQQLYPDAVFETIGEDHSLLEFARYGESGGLRALRVGSRPRVFLASSDLLTLPNSAATNSELRPDRFWFAAFALSTDGGRVQSRATSSIAPRRDRPTLDRLTVWRARHEGTWDPEPMAWTVTANRWFNTHGVELQVREIGLDQLTSLESGLVHLAGVDAVTLRPEALQALINYAERPTQESPASDPGAAGTNRTILIETVGGQGSFAASLRRQIEAHVGRRAKRLNPDDALRHPLDANPIHLRRYAVTRGYSSRTPHDGLRLLELRFGAPESSVIASGAGGGGGGRILFSDEDLSTAALGCRWWPIVGYTQETSRAILDTLICPSRMPSTAAHALNATNDLTRSGETP